MNAAPIPTDDDRPWGDDETPEPKSRDGYLAATREQLANGKVPLPATPERIRCLTADEFFREESATDLVVPALGIAAGPPTGIVGQAYVGKTILALSMGLAVATGKDLWGAWSTRSGPWLHLDYEQGSRHTKSRVRRLARGMGITDDHLRALLLARQVRIAVYPDVQLTTEGAIEHFRRAFEGVTFVTCDSLRPMLGGLDENSSQVRGYMSALSSASDSSRAAVALIHHIGKTPTDGAKPRKEQPRGSSGIVDELQSMFV
ncbi:MAG: AAA family ATPase, partial [Polyangiaceae bacterium]